jgi:hypothetical protein
MLNNQARCLFYGTARLAVLRTLPERGREAKLNARSRAALRTLEEAPEETQRLDPSVYRCVPKTGKYHLRLQDRPKLHCLANLKSRMSRRVGHQTSKRPQTTSLNADLDGQLLHEEGHVVFTGIGGSPTITRTKTATLVKIR